MTATEMTLTEIRTESAKLAAEWEVGPGELPGDPIDRKKAYALLLAAKICVGRDTVHSPPPVLGGDGFAEHMACVLSERWSLVASDYVGSILERRYALIITEDSFLSTWTVKVRPRVFGDNEFEDEDVRGVDAEGSGESLSDALDSLIAALQEQDAKTT
jgi:hypothetical protein